MEEREPQTMEEVQPVDPGESIFFRAVLKGSVIGALLGIFLGVAIGFAAKAVTSTISGGAIVGVVVGTIAGSVFLGMSIACGLNIKHLGVEQRFEEDPGAPGTGTPV